METHPVALPPTIALAPGSAFWASPLGAIWPPWWPQRPTCRDLPFRCWSTPRRMWKLEEKFRAGRSEEGHNLYWLVVTGTFGLFFHILGTIIPTDFHIFQRGRYTTNQYFPVIIHIFMVFSTINHPYHPFIDDWTRSPSPPHFPLSAPQHGLPGLVWVQHNFGRLLLCHLDILSWWLFVHF